MAKEHEAGKKSISEIFKFSQREIDEIVKKIDTIKTSPEVQKDKSTLSTILAESKTNFDRNWEDRKLVLTRHAKFRIHSSETDLLSNNLSDTLETLKIRTSFEESQMSVNSAANFVAHLENNKLKVRTNVQYNLYVHTVKLFSRSGKTKMQLKNVIHLIIRYNRVYVCYYQVRIM